MSVSVLPSPCDYEMNVAREWGISEGRALMALEHGIPDLELFRANATYHAVVSMLFHGLAEAGYRWNRRVEARL